jgi:hypothetical protein
VNLTVRETADAWLPSWERDRRACKIKKPFIAFHGFARFVFCPHTLLAFSHFLVFVFFLTSGVSAEEEIRYTADVSRLPVGGDVAALGDVGVVLPRHASAVIWNPASPVFLPTYEVSAEGADLYTTLAQQGCFAGSIPVGNNLTTALCYQPFYSGLLWRYDSIPDAASFSGLTRHKPTGYFKNYHHTMHVSLARLFSVEFPRFSGTALPRPLDIAIGTSLKMYLQTMDPGGRMHVGMGYNADFGIIARLGLDYDVRKYRVSRELFLGAAFRDILPTEVIWAYSDDEQWLYSQEGYREPYHFAHYYGIAFTDKSGDLYAHWTFALSLHKEYSVTYHGGVEALFWEKVFFRVGFSHRTPTLGAGIRLHGWYIDYAFRVEEIALSFARLTVGATLPPAK